MPFIDITIGEGRSPDTIRELIAELHDATRRALGVPGESIRICVRETPLTHYAAGGRTIAERRAAEQPPGK
ncbi:MULTISPECIES: tautomerase family protein [Pseudonocardiaceae]|uniref:tautomerase family protein n=1 Tax=Pseudonocardiaceae TaxID=2070 RepID=UPI00248E0525|nr:tautomerase family protein [Pseudonocardia thermophila]